MSEEIFNLKSQSYFDRIAEIEQLWSRGLLADPPPTWIPRREEHRSALKKGGSNE